MNTCVGKKILNNTRQRLLENWLLNALVHLALEACQYKNHSYQRDRITDPRVEQKSDSSSTVGLLDLSSLVIGRALM